jgi:pyruvate dehydrogenase E1 component
MLPGALPAIAASDYARAYPQTIAPHVRGRFVVLGTDGFGRSDTRAALRAFFEVDRTHIALAALQALAQDGILPPHLVADAVRRYGIRSEAPASWNV